MSAHGLSDVRDSLSNHSHDNLLLQYEVAVNVRIQLLKFQIYSTFFLFIIQYSNINDIIVYLYFVPTHLLTHLPTYLCTYLDTKIIEK